MCGICATCSPSKISENGKKLLWSDLKVLLLMNYGRGKDATGMFGAGKGIVKDALETGEFLGKYYKEIQEHTSNIMMAHNRQSSIYAKWKDMAHPFEYGNIVGIHNGSLTNLDDLKTHYDLVKTHGTIDLDSKAIFAALDKKSNFDVLRKYDGTANIIFYNKPEADSLYFYKDPQKPLFYGNKDIEEGVTAMFITSTKEGLINIGIDDKDITKCDDNKLYRCTNGVIDQTWNIKRDPLKIAKVYTNNYSNYNQSKHYNTGEEDYEGDSETKKTYKDDEFSTVKEKIDWAMFKPTINSTQASDHYSFDSVLSVMVRNDIKRLYHPTGNLANLNCRGKKKREAFYDFGKSEYAFTGGVKWEGDKENTYYVNGNKCYQQKWKEFYEQKIIEAEKKWLETKKTSNSVKEDCPVPTKVGAVYLVRGRVFSGKYDGTKSEDRIGYAEDETLIGKYFLRGTIVTKSAYDEFYYSGPDNKEVKKTDNLGWVNDEVENDKEKSLPIKLTAEEETKLIETSEAEQEYFDNFMEVVKSLSELEGQYPSVNTKPITKLKNLSAVCGQGLLEALQEFKKTFKTVSGVEFTETVEAEEIIESKETITA